MQSGIYYCNASDRTFPLQKINIWNGILWDLLMSIDRPMRLGRSCVYFGILYSFFSKNAKKVFRFLFLQDNFPALLVVESQNMTWLQFSRNTWLVYF